MKSRTLTVSVSASRDTVFAFLGLVDNLTLWAREAIGVMWREGPQLKARTPLGERHLALVADERTGVIDLFVGEQPDQMTLWPMRVVSHPHGAVVVMTLMQAADEPDEWFERSCVNWMADLRNLAARFGGGELQTTPRECAPFFPGIVSADFFGTWNFYSQYFGFRTVAECDVYVQLEHPSGAQIAVLHHELDGSTPELVSATDGRGFWLNLDVADADAEFSRLSSAGLEIVTPPEDKPWGERMFVVRDPNGVLIALSHKLPAREPLSSYPAAS